MNKAECRLIVVYDNNTSEKGLTSSWGFACLVILPQYHILFDTGGDPSILDRNMHQMHIAPEKIDSIVLSHGHGDHTGGLTGFLQFHHDVAVYLPNSFPTRFKKGVILRGARVQEVGVPMMIHPGVYTTGELGKGIKEQSLVLKTIKGLVIITGCAHPGIIEIVKRARRLFKDKVHLLIGGFHLMGSLPRKTKGIIGKLDALKVGRIGPCHCSGDTARKVFRKYYEKDYIECGVGLSSELPDLKE